jgi:hypothetical protein
VTADVLTVLAAIVVPIVALLAIVAGFATARVLMHASEGRSAQRSETRDR